jgi:oligoribonuclease NrnB/cAMP/cGMP phosphodiesterase (DHH superfamily)
MKDIICIYHSQCADGFTAAWVVKEALDPLEKNVEFYPGVYQKEPPDVTNKTVFMVDFSYKSPIIKEMLKKAKDIYILDHHKSAIEDLSEIKSDNFHTVFDINRSGARITWDYFFPDCPPPQFLLHVEDRDLWKFELDGTKEIQSAIFSYPYEFRYWDYFKNAGNNLDHLIRDGIAITRKHLKDINELLSMDQHRLIINGIDVPACNLSYIYSSEAGNIMSKNEKFAVCYTYVKDGVILSMRSQPEGMDVSIIASTFGGGGHFAASGCKIPHSRVSWKDGIMIIE